MFFSWVRCFLWTTILHSSFQFQGPDGSYSVIQENFSPMSYPRSCACPDKEGKMYNLEPLGSKDKKPRFSVNGTKYKGYSYSYNPCSAFQLGPKNSSCRGNVAICWWVPNLRESADTYKTIGIQKRADCGFDDDEDKTPIVVYQASKEFQNRTSIVRLKCDEGKKDKAVYEILDEDNWKFQLTHFWDVCRTKSMPDPEPPTSNAIRVLVPVASVLGLLVLLLTWRYARNRNRDNNNDPGNDEGRPLLDNGAGDPHADVIHNQIEEWNPANRPRPMPIGASHTNADVNVITSSHA